MEKVEKTNDFEFKEPRIVLICAFRYALGRSTYMPSVIVDEIVLNWDKLTEHDKKQIKDDIKHAIKHDMAGMGCDVRTWEKILKL